MATVKNIRHTPSGVYATILRGGDKFEALLNHKLPRFDALNSGTYVEISETDAERLRHGMTTARVEGGRMK